jgi:hypothetical protein
MRRLARLGAERRLEELRQEEAAIRAAFPELGGRTSSRRGRRGTKSAPGSGAQAGGGKTRQRRRYKMSAAQKKAVSDRMRKYWAARRKAEG